ncbi:V-set and immunoglobulin domain-containing protein 1-like [Gastrophryne carolinensis]
MGCHSPHQRNIFHSEVYAYQNGVSFIEGRFKNRVTVYNSTNNATITISNMQPQDTGFYTCSVSNIPESEMQGQIHVIVQVPPSTPHCSIEGNMAVGQQVKLTCLSGQGMPLPVYTWSRIKSGVVSQVNVAQANGVMIIGNLTKFEDGYYRCTASNSLGNASCELDLHTGGEAGVIVGGLIGAVLLATIIIVVIWFLVVKKKHKAHKVTEMKTMSSPSGANTAQAEAEEHAKQNLVVSESPEVREYRDQPEHAAADPAV